MARPVVGSMSEWSGMLSDLLRQIGDGSLRRRHLQRLLEHRDPFAFTYELADWLDFYRELFGSELLMNNVTFTKGPYDKQPNAVQLIVANVGYDKLKEVCMECFDCRFGRFQGATDVRSAESGAYAIWIDKDGTRDITLAERLLYELFYWWLTGKKDAGVHGYTIAKEASLTSAVTPPCIG